MAPALPLPNSASLRNEKPLVFESENQAAAGVGCGGSISICRMRKLFSSLNWSSSARSSKNAGKNLSSRSRLLMSMRWTGIDLFGLATNTCIC